MAQGKLKPVSEEEFKKGKDVYDKYCAACHGEEGDGYCGGNNRRRRDADRASGACDQPDILREKLTERMTTDLMFVGSTDMHYFHIVTFFRCLMKCFDYIGDKFLVTIGII